MFHMMEWSSEVWLFVTMIGIISFFLIILILLYMMRKGTNKLENTKSSDQQLNKTEFKTDQHLNETQFCPDCGAKFDEKGIVYCPACGHEIQ